MATEKKTVVKTPMPVNSSTKYSSSLSSEHFMFPEMRITASLMADGLSDSEIIEKIVSENLYQLPTEKILVKRARTCLKRLKLLNSDELINAIAHKSINIGKQICLYAMMRWDRIVWEFMITAIGEKIKIRDYSYSKSCINVFLLNLQAQSDVVAKWSPKTVHRISEVLGRILIENGYIENTKSNKMTPPILEPSLARIMKLNGDTIAMSAFENLC